MGRFSERCALAKVTGTQKELTEKEKAELEKKQKREKLAKVATILRKCETLRTPDETRFLEQCSDSVKKIRDRKERREIYKDRVQEKEDPASVIEAKARKLAEAIQRARHLICYTGAGISTSAKIPDYRGSNGIWTLLAQGKSIGQHDLSLAEPTFTHMALFELHRRKMLKFVVSQNCDGLHLRSGLPRYSLSEVHGNMYVEACKSCKPNTEYWRLFDTTELTARYNHKTNRRCYACNSPLIDTIVHFGERGSLKWPLNWAGACKQSEEADTILCLGSSLKVLKKYSWLWAMDRPVKKRPKLYIVNLQWTPKDGVAALKVNGKCDEVMRLVMQHLGIEVPPYRRERDPIFVHASMLSPAELHTVSQPMLKAQVDEGVDSSRGVESDDRGLQTEEEPGTDTDDVEVKSEKTEDQKLNVKEDHQDNVAPSPSPVVSVMDLQKRLNRFEDMFKTECEAKVGESSIKSEKEETAVKEEPCQDSVKREEEMVGDSPSQKSPRGPNPAERKSINDPRGSPPTQQESTVAEEEGSKLQISEAIKTLYKFSPSPPQQQQPVARTSASETNSLATSRLLGSTISTATGSSSAHYQELLRIYRSLESTLPHWNNPKYAYSGLHSIILPPPPELNLWGSVMIPIIRQKLDRRQPPPPPQCLFCYENYSELVCQFYDPKRPEFPLAKQRNGKPVVCECCDHSDEEEDVEEGGEEEQDGPEEMETNPVVVACPRRQSNELNEISNNVANHTTHRNGTDSDEPSEKVPKLQTGNAGGDQKENGTGAAKGGGVVQAGWYGKGYRKYRSRKRKS